MKFLIQRINGEIRHDFAFALLESIRFNNWCRNPTEIKVKFLDYIEVQEPSDIYPIQFKPMHKNCVPIGSVEFVSEFIQHFYGLYVKPINVPEELFDPRFTKRQIFNGTHLSLENCGGKYFVKSNDQIKYFSEIVECEDIGNQGTEYSIPIPVGHYQISEYVNNIESEWRAFVYKGKLIGLQNYCGDFTLFPNPGMIRNMIKAYKSAPIAYTLDVGVYVFGDFRQTIVIEVHDFFSCGLYGFSDSSLPHMFSQWFWQYIQINMVKQYANKEKNENE